MMVTFVSECEKKALNRTRRVLDSFANRIGSRTWQTVITNEGLQAVKKLLRKTATKNTAVSCHWIRSRSRSELVWIVGNRDKFNHQGYVAVNTTQKMIKNTQDENDWQYLPLIKILAAFAALWHDWGKSSDYFQTKLKNNQKTRDPLRHEWVSLLFFNAYVAGSETDEQWLSRLSKGEFADNYLQSKDQQSKKAPLYKLPDAASIVAWLILSHHLLPSVGEGYKENSETDFKRLFRRIRSEWGYKNLDDDFYKQHIDKCFAYSKNLPFHSASWLKAIKKQSNRLVQYLPLLQQSIDDGSWRLVLLYTRLALMLGDHHYSSLEIDDPKRLKNRELKLYANTAKVSNKAKPVFKQTLDEHLLGVAKQAQHIAHFLPKMEKRDMNSDEWAHDVNALKRNSPGEYSWQDKAVRKIKQWREQQTKQDDHHYGFFAVNMASTGKGKTFANAKIMRALAPNAESLRYILALGLRTLTLQTGKEYQTRIGLNENELAVLIGSKAILELFNQQQREQQQSEELTGSESEQALLDNDLLFDDMPADDWLATVLKRPKDRQFLYAPVLSCTIDHLMAATETKRGGRHILPTLRLMSSDLVIDEIDDFSGDDLIAIGRLIHLAGMLGRKVMISSATISPDLAEGYFHAYQSGWSVFSTMRQKNKRVGCAWIDEFDTQVVSLEAQNNRFKITDYQTEHQQFIHKRIQNLAKQLAKRKVGIQVCSPERVAEFDGVIDDYFAYVIKQAIIEKHHQNHLDDEISRKKVSFGVVRVANIKPCITVTRKLLNADWPEDMEVRIMAYHSQQVLIMRNEQEKHLDEVLNRSNKNPQHTLNHPYVRKQLDTIQANNVLFIVVATPVEEVGRDHDFDWAVVELSSYRSLIQLAGRIKRHREQLQELAASNMALLQFNLKGLNNKNIAFNNPGYESKQNPLASHDLMQLLDIDDIAEKLDARARISKPEVLDATNKLVDLEHACIQQLLCCYDKLGPESLAGWVSSCWWLTGEPQQYVQFRKSVPQLTLFLFDRGEGYRFCELDKWDGWLDKEHPYGIERDEELTELEQQRLWLRRDYEALLEQSPKDSIEEAAAVYGEANFPKYKTDLNDLSFCYSSQFGFWSV